MGAPWAQKLEQSHQSCPFPAPAMRLLCVLAINLRSAEAVGLRHTPPSKTVRIRHDYRAPFLVDYFYRRRLSDTIVENCSIRRHRKSIHTFSLRRCSKTSVVAENCSLFLSATPACFLPPPPSKIARNVLLAIASFWLINRHGFFRNVRIVRIVEPPNIDRQLACLQITVRYWRG